LVQSEAQLYALRKLGLLPRQKTARVIADETPSGVTVRPSPGPPPTPRRARYEPPPAPGPGETVVTLGPGESLIEGEVVPTSAKGVEPIPVKVNPGILLKLNVGLIVYVRFVQVLILVSIIILMKLKQKLYGVV